ncbi:unnamed protein product [Boreogadus saida]
MEQAGLKGHGEAGGCQPIGVLYNGHALYYYCILLSDPNHPQITTDPTPPVVRIDRFLQPGLVWGLGLCCVPRLKGMGLCEGR